MQPILQPKKGRSKKGFLMENIGKRGTETITISSTRIKRPLPENRLLDDLKASKSKLHKIREEKFRDK